jgi:hypothetical protein
LVQKGETVYESTSATLIGGDTRPSTHRILGLVTEGVQSQGGKVVNFGITTTPQLQYYGKNYFSQSMMPMLIFRRKLKILRRSELIFGRILATIS